MKTPKPLLTLRMVFPLVASLIALLLGEWIARGSLSADVFAEFIFPHIGAYLLAWLLLFLVWLLLDWVFRCPPLSTLGMAVLGCAPCAVNFYTLQLRGEPFLPWDLAQVSEAAVVASAAGLKIQTSMVVTIIVVLALTVVWGSGALIPPEIRAHDEVPTAQTASDPSWAERWSNALDQVVSGWNTWLSGRESRQSNLTQQGGQHS